MQASITLSRNIMLILGPKIMTNGAINAWVFTRWDEPYMEIPDTRQPMGNKYSGTIRQLSSQ